MKHRLPIFTALFALMWAANTIVIQAQNCPDVDGFLVNSCADPIPAGNLEGMNEMVIFHTGSYEYDLNNLTIGWTNTNYAATNGFCLSGCSSPSTDINDVPSGNTGFTINPQRVAEMNLLAFCPEGDLLFSPTSNIIPADATVIVFSGGSCWPEPEPGAYYPYDFTNLCGLGPIYVIFKNDCSGHGKFADDAAGGATISVTFGSAAGGCNITTPCPSYSVTYTGNFGGTAGNGSGFTVAGSGTTNGTFVDSDCDPPGFIPPTGQVCDQTPPDVAPIELCGTPSVANPINYTVDVIYVAANATLEWYNAQTGGTLLGTSTSASPDFTYSFTNTNSLWVLSNDSDCLNPSCRVEVPVTTFPLPTVAYSPASACAGTQVSLDAISNEVGATFSWYIESPTGVDITGSLNITDDPISFTPTETGDYIVFLEVFGANCNNNTVGMLTVSPSPSVNITGGAALCAGQNLNLTATVSPVAPTTYIWSASGGGNISGSTSGGSITATAAGTYNVTVTQNGCTATDSQPVSASPAPTASISGPSAVCAGGTVVLNASGAGVGGSYVWSASAGGSITSPATAATVTVTGAALYTVTVTNSGGCTAVAQQNVSAAGTPGALISGPTTICTGGNAVLTASGGGAGAQYAWTASGGGNISGAANLATITATTAGTYTVTVTSSAGCTATNQQVLTAAAPPDATISAPTTTLCPGNSTTLSVIPSSSYQWALNGSPLAGETNATLNVSSAGSYAVTVTNAQGCTASDIQNISSAASNPTASIAGGSAICPGATLALNASGAGAGGSYAWTAIGGGTISGATNTAAITATTAGTYTVTVTSSAGCTGSAAQNVLLGSNPNATILGPTLLCAGSSITLSASGGTGYQWQLNGSNIGGATNNTFAVNTAGDYTVVVSNAQGCTAVSPTQTVSNAPAPVVTISGGNSICPGLAGITLSTSAGASYQWQLNGTNISGATAINYTANTAGTYSVIVTNAQGCTGTASHIISNSSPTTPTISGNNSFCSGGNTILSASAATSYQWQLNGTNIGGATTTPYTATAAGSYTVVITDAMGCTAQSAPFSISVVSPPNAATLPPSSALCNNNLPGNTISIDLDNLLNGASAGGAWTTTAPAGTIAAGNIFNADGLTAGSYTVTYTATATPPCSDASSSQSIDVEFCPANCTENAQFNAPPNLCSSAGSTLDLNTLLTVTTTTGGTWTTSAPAGSITGSSTFNANGLVGTYTITYTVIGAAGCPNETFTAPINIIAPPDAATTSPATILCNAGVGNNIDLSALITGDTGGTWTCPQAPTAISGNTFSANGLAAGTYTLVYTVLATAPCTGDVQTQQSISVAAPQNTTLNQSSCEASYVLNAGVGGAGTWTVGGALAATISQVNSPSTSVTLSGGEGIYTFVWTPTTGNPCVNTVTISLTYAIVGAFAGNDDIVCGNAYTLGANGSSGTWNMVSGPGSAIFDDVSLGSTAISVSEYGSYTFVWTVSSGACSGSDEVSIFFFPEPTSDPTPTISEQVCGTTYALNPAVLNPSTGSIILGDWTDITGGGGIALPPAVVCGWQFTAPLGATVSFAPDSSTPEAIATVSQAGIYTFTWVCNGGGVVDCGLPNPITVEFVAPLNLNVQVACLGTTQYTVTVNISGGLPPYTANGIATGGNSYTQTYADGINYSIEIDDNSACNSQNAGGINPSCGCPPVPSPIVSGDPDYCVGEVIPTFSTTPFAPNYEYNWYAAGSSTPLVSNSLTFSPPADGDYYVVAVVQDGCTSLPTNFSIYQTPNPPIPNLLPNYTYCQNETAGILATAQTAGGLLYWISTDGTVSGSGAIFSPNTATVGTLTYQIFEEAIGFCLGTSAETTITVNNCSCPTINGIIGQPFACSGETITLSADINDPAGNLDHIEWHDENGNLVSGNIVRTTTGCTAQTFNYTVEIYCNNDPNIPFQVEIVPVTFYPLPAATVGLSNNGCTLTATPACPAFAIVGNNTATTNIDGDTGSVVFSVVNTEAQALGLSCTNSITGAFNCSIVIDCPTISSISTPVNVCAGSTVSLTATIDDPTSSADHVEWLDNNGAVVATSTSNTTLGVTLSQNPTTCNPQVYTYTFNVYCDDDPNTPSASQSVAVTFYPTPSATIDISADGCTALATPDCPNFSIVGSPIQSGTGTNAVNFTVRNNDAVTGGISGGCSTVVSGNFDCSTASPCPTILPIADISICSGETFNIAASLINMGNMASVNWTDELGNPISNSASLNGLTLTNLGCNVLTRTYTCNVFCTTDPNTPSDSEAFTVSVYPPFSASLLSFDEDPNCLLPPTVGVATCANYVLTPVSVPAPQAGDNTATWQITYNSPDACFDTLYTYEYTCPACFSVTNPANATASICDGDTPNWAVIMSNVTLDDPSGTFGTWQWYADAALTELATPAYWQHQGNSCEPFVATFYAGGICTLAGATAPIAGGQVSVTVYPDFDVSLLQATPGDCNTLPTLTTTCPNYILTLNTATMPTLPITASGSATWTVAISGSTCFLQNYAVPYVCGGCPVAVLGNAAPALACSGEAISLSLNIVPNTAVNGVDYSIQWQLNGADIAGATNTTLNTNLPTSDCNTILADYTAVFNCLIPGGQPAQNINAGNTTIHPTYNEANIAINNTDCALPTVVSACNYSISAPVPPPIAGQIGTSVWTVSSFNNCFADTTITINYNCPQCPTVATAVSATRSICDGTVLSDADLAAIANTVAFNDPSNTADGFAWYADAALTQILTPAAYAHSGGCAVEVFTLYLALLCSDGTQQAAGTLEVSVYPIPTTATAVGGCSLQVNDNCAVGNLTIEYQVGGVWQNNPPSGTPTDGQSVNWRAYVAGAPDSDGDGNPDCLQMGTATAQSCNCTPPTNPPTGVISALSVCAGTINTAAFSVTLDAGAFAVWYNAAGDSVAVGNSYTPTVPGNYTVQAFSAADTCAGQQIMATLTETNGAVATLSYAPDTLCLGGAAILPTLTGGIAGTYSSSGGISLNTNSGELTPDVVGTFTITFTPTAECDTGGDASVTIEACPVACTAPPAPIALVSDLSVCVGETNTAAFSVQAVAPDMAVVWYNAAGDSLASGTSFIPTLIGTYTAQVEMLNDTCVSNSINAVLGETQAQELTATAGNDLTICSGEAIALNGIVSAGGTATWSSSNGGTFGDINAPATSFDAPAGTYSLVLTASGTGSCIVGDTDTMTVTILPQIVISVSGDDTILEGESTQLTAAGANAYTWTPAESLSCADCAAPIASPAITTTYTISSSDACSEPAEFIVTVNSPPVPPVPPIEAILLPTAFSPNGDGQNDVFRAQASGTITDYYLVVYNRWGQMVFETTDLNVGWDGMYNGQQQEMGVYVYYARYTFAGDNEDLLRGNVTLLR